MCLLSEIVGSQAIWDNLDKLVILVIVIVVPVVRWAERGKAKEGDRPLSGGDWRRGSRTLEKSLYEPKTLATASHRDRFDIQNLFNLLRYGLLVSSDKKRDIERWPPASGFTHQECGTAAVLGNVNKSPEESMCPCQTI